MWATTNWKILEKMGIPVHITCLLRSLYADQEATVRTGHEAMDWFKIGKESYKAAYFNSVYSTYIQSTWCEMSAWMSYRLESRLLGEISITSHMQMTPSSW